ncbi:hypothetical protein ACFQT0_29800 [Hymenobacter humi]|uniref:TolC family protein n=1 Tax=Hymenobacter humi TaxID=1411620 RepID=A0ABW2UC58_9BACT
MEVSLYRVREQVESLFFGVLLADETTRLRQSLRADLRTRRTALAARRRYGTATGQDLARLDAETLSLDQQCASLALTRGQLLAQARRAAGPRGAAGCCAGAPRSAAPGPRPARVGAVQGAARPARRAGPPAQRPAGPAPECLRAGGLRPAGAKLFRNDLHAYGLGGLRLNWALSGYSTRHQDRELLRLGTETVAVQEQLFEQSQRLALAGQQAAIDRYRSQLATDQELIELRERIRATAAVQLANGIIGFADYFADASQLNQARLNLQLHRLQLLQAQAALLTAQEPPLRPLNLNLLRYSSYAPRLVYAAPAPAAGSAQRLPATRPRLRCFGQL